MASTDRTHPRTGEDESFNDRRTHPRPNHDRSNSVLTAEDYNVAWICDLPIEQAAAAAMLDCIHEPLIPSPGDVNSYTLGSIGTHNIVIACLLRGQYGTSIPGIAASSMSRSFPSINIRLMVGIGGGAPTREADVRLGDVVVGEQVILYGMDRTLANGGFAQIGPLRPSQAVSLAITKLRASHARTQSQVQDILLEKVQSSPQMAVWARPKVEDKLFESSVAHADDTLDCDSCNIMGLQIRPPRTSEGPIIHYGKIASSNKLIKDATVRDRLSSELGAICFEKEEERMMDMFPCLVIRGICDYSDSHKNKEWQRYASAVAAAYTVELLSMIPHNHSLQEPESSADRTIDLLNLLDFEERERRHSTIHDAHAKTCVWILRHPFYVDWLNPKKFHEHRGLLWVNGRSGAGKSTLMKFCVTKAQGELRLNPNTAVISFFFNARGGDLEKTTEGMYRSLLYQLLQRFPDLQSSFDALDYQGTPPVNPTTKTLQDTFGRTVHNLGSRRLICYIDALDECNEDQIHSMVEYFDQLGMLASQTRMLHVCFSSRQSPFLGRRQAAVKLRLELPKIAVNANACTSSDIAALCSAAAEGHEEVVGNLIKKGVNINACTLSGNTALSLAA